VAPSRGWYRGLPGKQQRGDVAGSAGGWALDLRFDDVPEVMVLRVVSMETRSHDRGGRRCAKKNRAEQEPVI
jgi:hypothetical protein